jgi:septum formation protein
VGDGTPGDGTGELEPIVLASASPRRRHLLTEAGLRFRVLPADVDEGLAGSPAPDAAAEELAARKARVVAGRLGEGPSWVVGSDTVVALGDEQRGWTLLGKPEGSDEARAMLTSLSGTEHRVVTGVCVVRLADGLELVESETTRVTMRRLTGVEVDAYVASGEWRDKAGGYAIQENADAFVTDLAGGGFDNVVGLPVARTLRMLAAAGAPDLPALPS